MATTYQPIKYELPQNWIRYEFGSVAQELVDAKAAVMALTALPYQKSWVEELQKLQLKREIAGTSKIEGADFSDSELDVALKPDVTPGELLTRSQRQANAALKAYGWIASLPKDRPITDDLIREVHRRIVMDCDDDHCAPGELRGPDCNVTFGIPYHRGCEGGEQCGHAFTELTRALEHEYQGHDLLIRALALHYHFAAMHPFLDGNGRTARAMEALVLQRAGLTDRAFIAMSNYYYDEKQTYLTVLSEVRAGKHDLTPFLKFGLRGIRLQCERLTMEIRKHMKKAIFRNMMFDLFNKLQGTRKRVIATRQIELLKILLIVESASLEDLMNTSKPHYINVERVKAFIRDINGLLHLGAITLEKVEKSKTLVFHINLDWPQQVTDGQFFETVKQMPKAKTYKFLQ